MLLSRESREILTGKDQDGNDIMVSRMQQNERMQQGVDALKDKRKRDILVANIREANLTMEQGLRTLYWNEPGTEHIIECVLRDARIDPNRDFLDSIATPDEIQREGMAFWQRNPAAIAINALAQHKFFQGFLGEANIFSGRMKSGIRFNERQFQELRQEPRRRASNENTLESVTVDEPVITYYDRPVRDSERTMYQWGIQDIIMEVAAVSTGTLSYRQVISDVLSDDEVMTPHGELAEGALVSVRISKDEGELETYKVGIQVSDEFRAGAIRMNVLMRTQARIGRFFNRACLLRMLNLFPTKIKSGNTPYGPAYTQNSSGALTGQHWGKVEDSYEVETMNRVVGKKSAVRALKEMNMGTENQTYAQYYQRPTQFYDLGMGFADIGMGGINSSSLASDFSDRTLYSFDVMSTCILYVAPWLEMDEDTRDAPTGSLLTSMRTAVDENIEDNNSIRKITWAT